MRAFVSACARVFSSMRKCVYECTVCTEVRGGGGVCSVCVCVCVCVCVFVIASVNTKRSELLLNVKACLRNGTDLFDH